MMKKQKHPEIKLPAPRTCIVVGPMPFKEGLIKKTLEADLIYIDGGLKHKNKFKKALFTTYGDGDSAKIGMDFKKEGQNLSDLAFFLKKAVKKKNIRKYDQYLFLGFLGGRVDHELINLGEVSRFMQHFTSTDQIKVLLEDKIEFFPSGISEFYLKGSFSLVSFEDCKLKISGQCLYKSQNIDLHPLSSRGLSNEGFGLIKIQNSRPVALFKN